MLKGSGLEGNFDNQCVGVRAMRQLSALAAFGMIVLPIASCGNNSEDISSTPPPEAQSAPTAEPFPPPTIAQSPTVAVSPSLIQPTNGSQRAKQVQTGRQDPFAGLFIQTRSRETSSQVASQSASPSNTPASPSTTTPQATGNRNGQGADVIATRPPSSPANGGTPVNTPPVAPDNGIPFPPPDEGAFPPALPSIPEPELARKVAVSGVVQIGEQLQAIVQVPNEGTSRYVRVGQRLSNGEILVKRIEMTPGIEPVVILEQYGVEVAKAIGEQAVESDTPDATAPTPTPTPSPSEEAEPDVPPEVTSPAPPASIPTPVPVPINPPTVPNATPIPSPPPVTPGPGEF
ncbi:hypothetical protein NIES1031_18975 [Chroogloeocystis siderophila 5.2 s.c.1]|uniref:Uncharacterized protein n=2 Tax=Chroogloeocystis TaxID=329162 RepID=A0A1U7HH19_9CHRO|nr:hypothetical protein NIES1031_18975 [Chroogloeocystis siderophila 5.2 s.c.1]